jgi:hypothetical protein
MEDLASYRRGERVAAKADVRITGEDGAVAEATVVDISRYGLSIDGLQRLPADAPLRVTFADGRAMPGRAVWRQEFLDGIAFDRPLDTDEFDRLLASLNARKT